MASFMVSLWESIFTPGPTPTLLIATNATFGALQLLLVILLFFTGSIHFAILSVLCGGLWFGINWFAKEVAAAKAAEDADASEKTKRQTSPDPMGTDVGARRGGGDRQRLQGTSAKDQAASAAMPPPTTKPLPKPAAVTPSAPPSQPSSQGNNQGAASTHLSPPSSHGKDLDDVSPGATAVRRRSLGDSSGYVSTDSEWEKVSEGEDGK
ncbi:V-type ATPase assembly factor PKR1 [Cyphellophora attinorum]|uniref:V-type ATPase assembly factor PKR1 n=1 Tax=Cyphellophora attinorum TaxID=1664694 RepID=A0A0N0NLP8_9EURO|nr:V-type ATPase assembly factor PKR1 [Phialophora attinorum]KPI39428.1 V-type ATPase assembly factor PKR1 [Phialophora attinorum]